MISFVFTTISSFCLGMMLCVPSFSYLQKEWNKYQHYPQEVLFPKHPVVECARDRECHYLAEAAYYESRGESDEGVLLVMQTIINRVKHSRWETTIEGVVYEPYQFSYTHDGSLDRAEYDVEQWIRMYNLAYNFLQGNIQVPEEYKKITHYVHKGTKTKWTRKFSRVMIVGNHVAYECKKNC